VNLTSVDSGVGVKTYNNGTLLSTVTKNTALGYYYSGSWSHCWLEGGANTGTLVNNALNTWVPDHVAAAALRFFRSELLGTPSHTSSVTKWAGSAMSIARPTLYTRAASPVVLITPSTKSARL
jgi:hypothetical protein